MGSATGSGPLAAGAAALLALAGGACGGGGGPGAGGADGGQLDPLFGDFCAQIRELNVAAVVRCNGLSPDVARQLLTIDPCDAWGRAVTDGRMTFDASDAAACVAALQALPCDAIQPPPACDRVLAGRRAPGQDCNLVSQIARFSECEAGSLCVPGRQSCQGTCVKGGLLTEACDLDRPCVAGESCDLSTSTCTTRGGDGTPCGLDTIIECEQGLHCSDIFGGVCTAHLPPGAPCSGQPFECAPPAVCDAGLGTAGTCTVPPAPGDACDVSASECALGLSYCGADSLCHPLAGIGEPCGGADGEGTSCLVGACDTTAATPVCKPRAPGDSCRVAADCVPGALCVPGLILDVCSLPCL